MTRPSRCDLAVWLALIALTLARQNRMHEALKHFEAAVRLSPDNPGYRRNLQKARGIMRSKR